MHAVVVRVSISDVEGTERVLRDQTVPRVSQLPGFVAGYWTRKDNGGMSMVVFESEDAADSFRDMLKGIVPEGVTLEDAEVREVVAHA
jgi:hypothetical protein